MAVAKVKPKQFSGTSKIFDGTLEAKLNEIIDGLPEGKTEITALTPVATANATDLASAIALTNANKAAINALITALKA